MKTYRTGSVVSNPHLFDTRQTLDTISTAALVYVMSLVPPLAMLHMPYAACEQSDLSSISFLPSSPFWPKENCLLSDTPSQCSKLPGGTCRRKGPKQGREQMRSEM